MQNSRPTLARRLLLWCSALCLLVLLPGCNDVVLNNLTPSSLTENPSRIYTITLRIDQKRKRIVPGSLQPYLIIDGERHLMQPSRVGAEFYEFDYALAPGRSEIAYYFLVNYEVRSNDRNVPAEAYTELARASITGRYVYSLEANRGPVGARISVIGRGFSPQDSVRFDGAPVRSHYESVSSLSFIVPALEIGREYQVSLYGVRGATPLGSFRIDGSKLLVTPSALSLRTGAVQSLTFTLPQPAPLGGLLLDVTTDIPSSVIMDEVIVPAGQSSVTINVQGGTPGTGSLFLKGHDSGELTIPVRVTP